ncbi:hypothetical protein [Butyrivibrio sp. AE3006]|uniref:hypothetical protein n=1 Tax=Butyrivibrio sp. AE3006 TaxID=1280673 RepID=UPI000423DC78|nr:hypothetical protein [Butyrivibrio sp. AE3006]
MRKLSRFGAAALALALSVTFLTPVQVQAAKNENEDWLQKVNTFVDDDDVFDKNYSEIEAYGDSYEEAEKAFAKVALEKGFITETKPDFSKGVKPVYLDKTYYTNDSFDYYSTTVTKDGKDVEKFYGQGCIFTNTQTKKSGLFKVELNANYTTDEAKARAFQSSIRVKKGEVTYVAVPLSGGDTKIDKIKSSKKSIAKVSLYKKMSSESTTNGDNVKISDPDPSTGKYTVYYYTTVGAKVIVGEYDDYNKAKEAAKNAEMTASSATRYIKIDAKKSGKFKLTFNIVNKNGNVSKVKVTVYVVDDVDVFKTLTFAGQSLLPDKNNKSGFYAEEFNTFRTTKSKGKLVAKANANYVIKKIEVGKLYTENTSKGLDDYDPYYREKYSENYSAYSSSGKTTTHKVDLNGDGDFDDIINGVYESKVTYKYKKIKSGKTLKLSNVGTSYNSSTSYTSKYRENRKEEKITASNVSKTRNFEAPTALRITYYDKLLKCYGVSEYTITHPVSK